jgi:ABC-type transport system substrate-binding protein
MHGEFDQLVDRFTITLDNGERARQIESIVRIYTTELPSIPLYFNYNAHAYARGLRGLGGGPAGGNEFANIHLWEFV